MAAALVVASTVLLGAVSVASADGESTVMTMFTKQQVLVQAAPGNDYHGGLQFTAATWG